MNINELFSDSDMTGDCEVCGAAVPINDWICAACFLAITPPAGEA